MVIWFVLAPERDGGGLNKSFPKIPTRHRCHRMSPGANKSAQRVIGRIVMQSPRRQTIRYPMGFEPTLGACHREGSNT
jgi:hypothetical protein